MADNGGEASGGISALGSRPVTPSPERPKGHLGTLHSGLVRILLAVFWSRPGLPLRWLVREPSNFSLSSASSFSSISHARSPFSPDGKTREGMLLMKFKAKWREESCSVEGWYQAQCERSREQGSSTRFSVIQHRRTSESPFFHEFLIIPLADGSVYRVERTCVGIDADALSGSGCTAHDIIGWFSKEEYQEFIRDKPSDLIAEAAFPCEFDILDVVEICYWIQCRQKQYANYSLQCFNCYFFCCAILSTLARGFADQQMAESSKDQGKDIFSSALTRITQSPPETETEEFCLRISSRINLNGAPLIDHIATALRDGGQPSPRYSIDELAPIQHFTQARRGFMRPRPMIGDELQFSQLADSIWWSRLDQDGDCISQVTKSIKCDVAAWLDPSSAMCALPASADLSRQQTEMRTLAKAVVTETTNCSLFSFGIDWKLTRSYFKRTRTRYGSHFLVWIYRSILGVWFLKQFGAQLQRFGFITIPWCINKFVAWRRYRIVLKFRSHLRKNGYQGLKIGGESRSSECAVVANRVFDVLDRQGKTTMEDSAAAYLALVSAGYGDCLRHSTESLLRNTVADLLKELAVSKGAVVQLHKPTSGKTTLNKADIFTFQEHIQEHIQTYAQRVDENKLDSNVLICRDVRRAISELIAERRFAQEVVEEMVLKADSEVQEEASAEKKLPLWQKILGVSMILGLIYYWILEVYGDITRGQLYYSRASLAPVGGKYGVQKVDWGMDMAKRVVYYVL